MNNINTKLSTQKRTRDMLNKNDKQPGPAGRDAGQSQQSQLCIPFIETPGSSTGYAIWNRVSRAWQPAETVTGGNLAARCSLLPRGSCLFRCICSAGLRPPVPNPVPVFTGVYNVSKIIIGHIAADLIHVLSIAILQPASQWVGKTNALLFVDIIRNHISSLLSEVVFGLTF